MKPDRKARLERLAKKASESAEAADPRTSPERLVALMEGYAELVLANPAFQLLLVEQPDFWRMLQLPTKVKLVQAPYCPPALADWMLRQQTVGDHQCNLMALNRALPLHLRRQAFFRLAALDAALLAERNPLSDFLSPFELDVLGRCLTEGKTTPPLMAAEFDALAEMGQLGKHLAVQELNCPRELLERFASEQPLTYGDELLRSWTLPRHSNLSPEQLATYLRSPDAGIRKSALQNPSMTAEQIQAAMNDDSTRSAVAGNPALSLEWMLVLVASPDQFARAALAQNPRLPPELQLKLAADPESRVRQSLLLFGFITEEARALANAMNAKSRVI